VLPIGGVREKVLAANRADIGAVILPAENEPDLEELPPEVRDAMRFVLADTMHDVLEAAFEGRAAGQRAYRRRNELPSAAQAGPSAAAG